MRRNFIYFGRNFVMRFRLILILAVATCALSASMVTASPIEATFTLLTHPDFAGYKPSAPLPTTGDWLIGTSDDEVLPAANNPSGALSHNLADLAGAGGAGFNMAPSLTGTLTMHFTPAGGTNWNVTVTDLAYTGQASPVMFMNQFLVTPGSPATQNATFHVDGEGNQGAWQGSGIHNWTISYDLDFYFDTNASSDPINATFNDKAQVGFLIPVSELTPAGLSALILNDPAGFFSGDFHDYLLDVVKPALPSDAEFLLFTQMLKVNPDYAEPGLPITTSGLIGNTTIAYTTTVIPEPGSLTLLAVGGVLLLRRRRRMLTRAMPFR